MDITSNVFVIIVVLCVPCLSQNSLQRCYSCRSRGELGSCKDPFKSTPDDKGIESVPCASGWCGKMLETEDALKEEHGVATQRRCLQRGPSDNEERCAYTKVRNENVFMCFCHGDLCNNSQRVSKNLFVFLIGTILSLLRLNL